MSRLLSKERVRDLLLGLALLCATLALMLYPQPSMEAAKSGLALCYNVIIPSLFPFFVLSSLVVELGLAGYLGRLLEGLMRPLFHVSGACASAFALGFIGGYPVGAKTAISLYENGMCTKTEAERLLAFCNNSGPAFILGVVGAGVFASSRVGVLLYLAHAAASICIGILCPTLGIFIVLRRFSLLGDTLAHASLAGAATGILCSGNPILYAIGYSVAAGAGIDLLQSRFPRRSDLTLAIVLALSAGIAVTLMSSGLLHANAESFLFGSILTVDRSDAIAILVLTAAAVLLTFLLRYDMIYVAFDEVAAKFAGVRIRAVSFLFSVIAAASVAASIKILGALVISSMVAIPVASALQFRKGIRATAVISIAVSVVSAIGGLFASYALNVAPGGATALISVFILLSVILILRIRAKITGQS